MTAAQSALPPARRQVSYASLEEVLADAKRLVAANSETTGQWSLGQIIQHLAMALNASVNGFGFSVAWPIRVVGRLFIKGRILRKGLKPGITLPPAAAPALQPPPIDAATAVENLQIAVAHFHHGKDKPYAPHPVFGPLSAAETEEVQLRHAELHMSFVREPQSGGT